jgi:hypothetical protein
VISANGLIATANHVIDGAYKLEAYFASGDTVEVSSVVYGDQTHDIAVVRVPGAYYKPVQVAYRIPVVGEEVYAIGNSLDQGISLSKGIVSGEYKKKEAFIPHNAPISPGNSGGPLIDVNGQVIGVVDCILTGGQLMNYAVSTSVLENIDLAVLKPLTLDEYRLASAKNADEELTVVFINPFVTRSECLDLLPGVLSMNDGTYNSVMGSVAGALAASVNASHPDWKVIDYDKGLEVFASSQGLYYSKDIWKDVRKTLAADYIISGKFGLTYTLESHSVNIFNWKATVEVFSSDTISIYKWDNDIGNYELVQYLSDHASIDTVYGQLPAKYYSRAATEQYIFNLANTKYVTDIAKAWALAQARIWAQVGQVLD